MKLKALALPFALAMLAGCSTEEDTSNGNTGSANAAPSIFAQNSVANVNEGAVTTFSFNVTDDKTGYGALSLTVNYDEILGTVVMDKDTKTLRYSSPYLQGSTKTLSESFTLRAVDGEGLSTEQRFTVTTNDINDPVELIAQVPNGSFGFENTKTDKLLNLFMYENQPGAAFNFSVVESDRDADDVSLSFGVDGLFANQVTQAINEEGTLSSLTIDIPELNQPSKVITLTLAAQDNDVIENAVVNLTVLNRPTLIWNNKKSAEALSEKDGGTVFFEFSEAQGYAGTFTVTLTNSENAPLDFELPYTIDTANRSIVFASAGRVLGDQDINVKLTHSTPVQNVSGEDFTVTTVAEKTLTLKDDRDDDFDNTAPVITSSSNSATSNEGTPLSFSFDITDDRSSADNIALSFTQKSLVGSVTVDRENKQLIYTPPLLKNATKTFSEVFTLRATDPQGAFSERTFTVNALDINSAATVSTTPHLNSFGYENTQTETLLNLFMYEDQPGVALNFVVAEDPLDADIVSTDFTVSGLFYNQVKKSTTDENGQATLTFDAPALDVASKLFTFNFIAKDNDGENQATVNLTLLNKTSIAFAAGQSNAIISEKEGGVLNYTFSEATGYPGTFSVMLTDLNNAPLAFALPYSIDTTNRRIQFGGAGSMIGDQNVKVTISHSHTVSNVSGEAFEVIATAEQNIIVKDDRDDDYDAQVENYRTTALQIEDILNANEEKFIFDALATLLSLENRISRTAWLNGEKVVNEALLSQKEAFLQKESEINQLISAKNTQATLDKITEYMFMAERIGDTPREAITLWASENVKATSDTGTTTTVSLAWSNSGLNKEKSLWSHYVGNLDYGYFDTKAQNSWVYLPQFAYLGVIDEARTFCN